MNVSVYFKLIRWKNLFLIAYVFILFKYVLFPSFNIHTFLNTFQFLTLLFSVLFITGAGYIINDIIDIKADSINKPKKVIVSTKITIEKAKTWYKITNTIGISLGILLSLTTDKPSFSFIFIATSLLLYYYSKKLKTKPLIGNLTVAFIIALSILILPIFEINFTIKNQSQTTVIQIVTLLSIFAFLLNTIREVVKDIIDINGDYNLKNNTLPILLGKKRTNYFIQFLCVLIILLLVFILLNYAKQYLYTMLYLILFSILPLVYVLIKLNNSKSKKHFQKISTFLKICMFLGINSILIISYYH